MKISKSILFCISLVLSILYFSNIQNTLAAPSQVYVTTFEDEFDAVANGTCSLREAIQSTNQNIDFGGCTSATGYSTNPTQDLIYIDTPGTYKVNTNGGDGDVQGDDANVEGDLDILENVKITGTGYATTIIEGNFGIDTSTIDTLAETVQADRVFHVSAGNTSFGLSGVTVTGGFLKTKSGDAAQAYGAGILHDGLGNAAVLITSSKITGNVAAANDNVNPGFSAISVGSGIYVTGAGVSLTITGSFIENNEAYVETECPGGICGSTLVPYYNDFRSTANGAGVYFGGNNFTLQSTEITGNTVNAANMSGAGLYLGPSGTAEITDSLIDNNSGTVNTTSDFDLRGAGVSYNNSGALTISGSTISNNYFDINTVSKYVYLEGAGFDYGSSGNVTIVNSSFDNNSATINNTDGDMDLFGGGFYSWSGTLDIDKSSFTNNSITATHVDESYIYLQGGGLYLEDEADLTNVTISGNTLNYSFDNDTGADQMMVAGAGIGENSAVPIDLEFVTMANNSITDFANLTLEFAGPVREAIEIGGAWSNNAGFNFKSSILDNDGSNCGNYTANTNTSSDFNVDNGGTCFFSTAHFANDNSSANDLNGDPELEPLELEDGLISKTHPIPSSSIAVDNSDCFDLTGLVTTLFDQRISSRPSDGDVNGIGVCDSGAYELISHNIQVSVERVGEIAAGSSYYYEITVLSPDTLSNNVSITDILPEQVDYVSSEVEFISNEMFFSVSPLGYGNKIRRLNPSNGQMLSETVITSSEITVGADGLTKHPTTGVLYTALEVNAQPNSFLASIDPLTAEATVIGDMGNLFSDLAFDSNGDLFGISASSAGTNPDNLYLIDIADASTTNLANLRRDVGDSENGLAYNSTTNQLIYAVQDGGSGNIRIDTINPDTYAVAQDVNGHAGADPIGINSITYWPDQNVYLLGVNDEDIYYMDSIYNLTLLNKACINEICDAYFASTGLSFYDATGIQDSITCDETDGTVTCDLGDIGIDSEIRVRINVEVPSDISISASSEGFINKIFDKFVQTANAAISLTNTVTVSANGVDVDLSNNTDSNVDTLGDTVTTTGGSRPVCTINCDEVMEAMDTSEEIAQTQLAQTGINLIIPFAIVIAQIGLFYLYNSGKLKIIKKKILR